MTNKDFEILWDKVNNHLKKVRELKRQEYAPGYDTLNNLKRCAALENVSVQQAIGSKVSKHIVALYEFINRNDKNAVSLEQWNEKIFDIIVYMNLLYASILEDKKIDVKKLKF